MEPNQTDETIVSGVYDGYIDTQKEIFEIEIKKTRNRLFLIAAVILGFNLLAVMVAGADIGAYIVYIALVPVIVAGLAFLAIKEPLLAMIIVAIIILAEWIYIAVQTGGRGALSGWLGKAILIYLVLTGFQNARTAQKIKKELKA